MAEYIKEGVEGAQIDFADNLPTLDMLLRKKDGLLAVLDEESRFPKATDLSFTQKIGVLKVCLRVVMLRSQSVPGSRSVENSVGCSLDISFVFI